MAEQLRAVALDEDGKGPSLASTGEIQQPGVGLRTEVEVRDPWAHGGQDAADGSNLPDPAQPPDPVAHTEPDGKDMSP